MNKPHTDELLDAALGYARKGWPIFPCHPTSHHPLDPRKDDQRRGGFYLASTDIQQIRNWWTRWPDAAIALRTGELSGVFVIDIDPRHGGDDSLDELIQQHGAFPDTVECLTGGGGRHLYFRWPGHPVPCSNGVIAPGVDVKGDGGYVIVPPSDHQTGHTYAWELSSDPHDISICDAPLWLLERIKKPPVAALPEAPPSSLDIINEGCRNQTLASHAGHMRQIGMSAEEIEAALLTINRRRCRPPLSQKEVERISMSVSRYAPDSIRQAKVNHWPEQYLGEIAEPSELGPVLTCLADVQPREVEWLWPRRIAVGKITMLAGDPGLGKSFCSMDIAARISAGLPWPDIPEIQQSPGGVIVLSAEDALDDTIRPRLDAAEADPSRICALQAIREIDPKTGQPRQRGFHLDKDIINLESALKQMPDCRLVVVDPISSYMGDANSHNNAEVRGLLAPLSDLATKYRVAVLCVSHLNKGSGDAMYRVMGSLAFVAAARAGYAVVKDCKDDTGQRRLILPIKNNLGDDESGLAYRIVEAPGTSQVIDQPHVEWEPEMVYTTINEALGIEKTGEEKSESAERKISSRTQLEDAKQWLCSYLADGPSPTNQIIKAAKADGIRERTLERAKSACPQVVAKREGYGKNSRWMWCLVEIDRLVEQAQAGTTVT